MQSNLFDSDDENPITGHPGNPFISNPGNPFTQQQVRGHIPAQTTVNTDATTIIGNTMLAVASEFKKMREPKLAKLKGGITSSASLFFNSWVKDIRAVILEHSMSNAESLQLVKDYTEGKARQQVEFYIVSIRDPTFEGLIDNLKTSFQSGEDEATVKGEFYSRKQYGKESVDDFADVLQLLACKVLNINPSFQTFMNKSLCQQLANGLKDPGHGISARAILNQQPDIQFASFRSDLANILGCRIHAVRAKGALCNAAIVPESPDILKPLHQQSATKQRMSQPSSHNCPCVLRTIKNSIKNWTHSTQVKLLRSSHKRSLVAIKSLSKNQIHTKNQLTHLFCRSKSSRQAKVQIHLANHI